MDQYIVDKIYEAAIVPEYWPDVLESICSLSGAKASALVSFDVSGTQRILSTESYADAYADYLANGAHIENVRPKRALAKNSLGFMADLDVCTEEELSTDAIYTQFLRPHGFDWTAGTVIPVPSGDLLVFDLAQARGAGPFRKESLGVLDEYRPHLARAALMAHRLGMLSAQSQTDALQTIGLPAAAITERGLVVSANPLFEELAPRVIFGAHGVLTLPEAGADRLLRDALAGSSARAAATVQSMAVPAGPYGPALVFHLVPIRRAANDFFFRATSLIVVTPVTMPHAPHRDVLVGLFDLTPAEAKVAAELARGTDVATMASTMSLSVQTIRNQLKSVMAKTGTRRQAELALLLSGTQIPRENP